MFDEERMKMKKLIFAWVVAMAAGASFGADTWLWIGGSPNKYANPSLKEQESGSRDWRDGYNWTNLTTNVRGTLYPDNTVRPQDGDFLLFNGDIAREYTHAYHPCGDEALSYGGVTITNWFSGSFGPEVAIVDGGYVRYFASNASLDNQSFKSRGTFELHVKTNLSVECRLQGESVRKTGTGTLLYNPTDKQLQDLILGEGTMGLHLPDANHANQLKTLMRALRFDGPGTTFNLGVYTNATEAALQETANATGHGITATQAGARLTLYGTNQVDTVFSGRITGAASLAWVPSEATTLSLTSTASDSTGTLVVSNGTVSVATGTAFAAYEVWETGKLQFPSDATTTVPSGALAVNGAAVPDGLYAVTATRGCAAATWLAGTGIVAVGGGLVEGTCVDATWNGTGPLTTLANWNGATELPPLDTGATYMQVAGGASATVDTDAWLKGVSFAVKPFAFAGDGTHDLWLGSLGLTTPGNGGTYTLGAPVALAAEQTWTVGAGDTLDVTAPLSSVGAGGVAFGGTGTVDFQASSPDLSGPLAFTNGYVTVKANADNAFGTGPTVFNLTNSTVDFAASRYAGPIEMTRTASVGLSLRNDRDYVFNGRFTYHGGGFNFKPNAGKTWTFSGFHFDKDKQTQIQGGTVVFTNDILKLSDRSYLNGGATVVFAAPNNQPGGNEFIISGQGATLKTTVDYAFNKDWYPVRIAFCSYAAGGSVWDLCGTEQSIKTFQGGYGAVGTFANRKPGRVISAKPGMLHVDDDSFRRNPSGGNYASATNWTIFAGMAGFSKEGAYAGHWLMSESTSTGTVQVTKGKLYFAAWTLNRVTETFSNGKTTQTVNEIGTGVGSWPNASKAVAKGTGTLVLEHSQAIGRQTDVVIEASGKVQLEAGVNQRCHDLYFDGVRQRYGTWGSTASAAVHKDARFAGTGVLRVYGDGPATTVIVR